MSEFVYAPPTEPWLDILHQDKDLLVLNKPSGILSVPGRGEHLADSLYTRVVAQFANAQSVHRLDLSTSGVIVFALRRKAERELERQFRERKIKKTYYARVWGCPESDKGKIELPLIVDQQRKPMQKVCHKTGRSAITRYEVVSRGPLSSLIKLTPLTGRSHQLRVHMMAIGHPILGDNFYAHPAAQKMASRLLLHARCLGLSHPYSGEWMEFIAEPDFD